MRFLVAEGAASGKPAWWLLDDAGRKVAWSGSTFPDRSAALAACVAFRGIAATQRYEVYLDGREQPRWRVRDERGRIIAIAATSFANRSLAVADAHRVKSGAGRATPPAA
jgi:hypothetical protein